jgi:hypothetical protein
LFVEIQLKSAFGPVYLPGKPKAGRPGLSIRTMREALSPIFIEQKLASFSENTSCNDEKLWLEIILLAIAKYIPGKGFPDNKFRM